MTIKYIGVPPLAEGYYLVRVDDELDIAQYMMGEWMQIGSDYDYWQYSSDVYNLQVLKKLDLDELSRLTT